MEKIPVAIIGLGRIASLLEDDALREKPCTHAGAVSANTDCVLVAGFDTDAERRDLFSSRWNCAVYDNAKEMLEIVKPQILHIATHPDSHYHYCALAESYKIPVVVCEKPLADTLHQAKKIAAIHNRGISKIITNHERRYSNDYQQAKELLHSGELGTIESIRGTLYMGKTRRLLDVLWHDGTHLADIMMFLGDGVLKHRKTRGQSLKERSGTSHLLSDLYYRDKKIPCMIELGAGRDHLVFEVEISLSEGRIRIGNGIFEVWKSRESPYAEGFRSLEKIISTFEGPTSYFANMEKDAVVCVKNPSLKAKSSALDGLRVITYLNSIKSWK
jgi:predicted dehydrogenase